MEILLNKEQAEDIISALDELENICSEFSRGTLIYEYIEIRDYLKEQLKSSNEQTNHNRPNKQ